MRRGIVKSIGIIALSVLILALGMPSWASAGIRFHSHFGFGHGFHRPFHHPKFFVFPHRPLHPHGFSRLHPKPFHHPHFFFPDGRFHDPPGVFHRRW
jgi:hypothetical protein